MMWLRFIGLGLVFAVLAGCAGVQTRTSGDEQAAAWQRHAAWLRAQPDWSLQGRFALNVGKRGWTASLRWVERDGAYRIDISDPLGRTVAQLAGRSGRVILRSDGTRPRVAASAADLMQSELGWSLPVAGLRYWVRGLPAPDSRPKSMHFDGSGRLVSLRQDGWDVSYLDYDNAFGAQSLPVRLRLINGDVRLTLLVDRWGGVE